jgi:putative glutamine amidotransferase
MIHKPHGQPPRRPNIGITPDIQEPRPDSPLPHYELKAAYADAVLRAGGLPLVLPYVDDPSCVEAYLDRISGLLVTGGALEGPLEPPGELAAEGGGPPKLARTAFESALMRGALKRNMPVLGICGGMQLLNGVLGGTLFQDIPREVPGAHVHEQRHDYTHPIHPVEIKDGTLLAEALGKGQLMVNSTHRQAVARTGEQVVVSAAAPDGVVEGIESTHYGFALGVQWHPELMINTVPMNVGVYRLLVQKARDHRR